MKNIPISEFRTKCFALLRKVQKTKKPIRITRLGEPLAEVVPSRPGDDSRDWIGSMKDTMKILGDITSPISSDRDQSRAERDARDIELINANADELNADALDCLEFQAPENEDDVMNLPEAKKKSRRHQHKAVPSGH